VLIAIASSGAENIYSRDFITDNDLGAASSIQTSIKLLLKKEIVDRVDKTYYITDVFLKDWIRKEMVK
jgi:hypothetical protein